MIRTLLISGLGAAICVSGYPAKGIAAVIAGAALWAWLAERKPL